MKLQFRCKNGKAYDFTFPDGAEIHRAIMWVPKGNKKDKTDRFIIIPDDVESVEVIENS